MKSEHTRMMGVFGKREPELAAIRILDARWRWPRHRFTLVELGQLDELELQGFIALVGSRWILKNGSYYVASVKFWERVHGR